MKIISKPMGDFQTNCYIVSTKSCEFIIDPGMNALSWIKQNAKNPIAILNTHGHFDHVWSNADVKSEFNIPIYCPKNDVFMLSLDPFGMGMPQSQADYEVKPDEEINFENIKVKFHFFSGHTPGCSAIEIKEDNETILFSGDFIFNGSIGRTDFPYSNSKDMIKSINKILTWDRDIEIYSGHGTPTQLSNEKSNLKKWINYLESN